MVSSTGDGDVFASYGEFEEDVLPEPGSFLEGCTVLKGRRHLEFHENTRQVFEERGVYDMTFGYNLAKLNLDRRHPDAGYRYGEQSPDVLRAEFTPTTEFCPQAHTLARGSYRAWNDLSERHGYDEVRVRVAEVHHDAEAINRELSHLEENRS